MIFLSKTVYGTIYKITNKANGKCYIGQTTWGFEHRYGCSGDSDIEKVYNTYKSKKERGEHINNHLFSAIEKYGFCSFVVEKEFDTALSKEELDKKEAYYISKFNCIDNGYNNKEGGAHGKFSIEARKKISVSTRERIREQGHPSLGKARSEASKARMRDAQRLYYMTHNSHRLGATMSDETKKKLSDAHTGKTLTEEHRRKIGVHSKGSNNPAARVVYVYDLEFNFVAKFETVNDCGDWLLKNKYFVSRSKEPRATMRTLISRNIKRERPFANFILSYHPIGTAN